MPREITKRPTKTNPALVKRLAKATLLARELNDLLNAAQLAPDLGIRKQSYEAHVQKAKKEGSK